MTATLYSWVATSAHGCFQCGDLAGGEALRLVWDCPEPEWLKEPGQPSKVRPIGRVQFTPSGEAAATRTNAANTATARLARSVMAKTTGSSFNSPRFANNQSRLTQ